MFRKPHKKIYLVTSAEYGEGAKDWCEDSVDGDKSIPYVLEFELDKLRSEADDGRRYRSMIEHGLICATCGGTGTVGSPPDDYFSCPDCAAPINKMESDLNALKAENERLKGVIEDLQNQIFDEHQEKVLLAGRNE